MGASAILQDVRDEMHWFQIETQDDRDLKVHTQLNNNSGIVHYAAESCGCMFPYTRDALRLVRNAIYVDSFNEAKDLKVAKALSTSWPKLELKKEDFPLIQIPDDLDVFLFGDRSGTSFIHLKAAVALGARTQFSIRTVDLKRDLSFKGSEPVIINEHFYPRTSRAIGILAVAMEEEHNKGIGKFFNVVGNMEGEFVEASGMSEKMKKYKRRIPARIGYNMSQRHRLEIEYQNKVYTF